MNYYMAYGGTNYGRTVGGPLIVTSYDYDVHINEYAMRSEPKFSLLTELHRIVQDNKDILLGTSVPKAAAISKTCESHTYSTSGKCLQFLSNWGETESCVFGVNGDSVTVPAWSVSVIPGSLNDADMCATALGAEDIFNTRTFATAQIKANQLKATVIGSFKFQSDFAVESEPVPSTNGNVDVTSVLSQSPLEQLSVTRDRTDYLWYSANYSVPVSALHASTPQGIRAVVTASVGAAGGGIVYAFVNGVIQSSSISESVAAVRDIGLTEHAQGHLFKAPPKGKLDANSVALEIMIPEGSSKVQIDLLSVSMGIQNYGPYIESYAVGIVSDITLTIPETTTKTVLGPILHSVGLKGETTSLQETRAGLSTACDSLCWYQSTFLTPVNTRKHTQLALDMSSMGKGFVLVNGQMLGRYWNVIAEKTAVQDCNLSVCTSDVYAGAYSGDKCRSGCGDYSQRYYKLPAEWLREFGEGANSIVIFDEFGGGSPQNIQLVEMTMETL
jgi:beta-galactosidase